MTKLIGGPFDGKEVEVEDCLKEVRRGEIIYYAVYKGGVFSHYREETKVIPPGMLEEMPLVKTEAEVKAEAEVKKKEENEKSAEQIEEDSHHIGDFT